MASALDLEADVQVGGHYQYSTISIETGQRVITGGVYHELAAPERLAFTRDDDGSAPHEAPLVRVTLEPHAGGTLLYFELRSTSGVPAITFSTSDGPRGSRRSRIILGPCR